MVHGPSGLDPTSQVRGRIATLRNANSTTCEGVPSKRAAVAKVLGPRGLGRPLAYLGDPELCRQNSTCDCRLVSRSSRVSEHNTTEAVGRRKNRHPRCPGKPALWWARFWVTVRR